MNRRNFLKAAVGAALVPVGVGLIPASGRDGWFNEQSLEDAVAALRLDRQYIAGVGEIVESANSGNILELWVSGKRVWSVRDHDENWYPGIATIYKEAQHTQNIYWRSILNRRPT